MRALALGLALGSVAGVALAQGIERYAGELTGEATRPGPGDPDGSGAFELTVYPDRQELCYELTVEEIEPATGAHVHAGSVGEIGPTLLALEPPTDGASQGCVRTDGDLLRAIAQQPSSFYLSVVNAEFPWGALRGPLAD